MSKMVRFFIMLFAVTTIAYGQAASLDEAFKSLSSGAAQGYVGPIISGFGANLNSGWIHRTPEDKKFRFDLEVGVVAMGTMFGDESKEFDVKTKFRLGYNEASNIVNSDPTTSILPQSYKDLIVSKLVQNEFTLRIFGPTILGDSSKNVQVNMNGNSITITKPTGGTATYTFNNSIKTGAKGVLNNLKAMPLAAPQLTFGTIFGTTLAVRYLPSVKISEDLGEFKYTGFGIQHNPAVWLPFALPLDFSVGYFTQKMTVGKYFEAKATTMGAYVSKKLGWGALNITPYGGFAVESSNVDVKYDFILSGPTATTNTTIPITFNLEGENKSRITVGASIKILLFNINADYSIGKYKIFSGGVSVII